MTESSKVRFREALAFFYAKSGYSLKEHPECKGVWLIKENPLSTPNKEREQK